jgi:hypothetical protein
MRRQSLEELHYITPIENVSSILKYGILSHVRARQIEHLSVAMGSVQDRRDHVRVLGTRWLHEYANLYFCARNPMMYKRKDLHEDLCVLRVRAEIIDLPGVVISDRNAASDEANFAPAPVGLSLVNRRLVFADSWYQNSFAERREHKQIKCAEVLIPDLVNPEFVLGAFVSGMRGFALSRYKCPSLSVKVNPKLFFQKGRM